MHKIQTIEDYIFISENPEFPGPRPLVLLLHGLTGDEKVMFVFASRVPAKAAICSPRGFYPSSLGGYSWCNDCNASRIGLEDLKPAVEKLRRLITIIRSSSQNEISSLHLIGFSQGASLALAWLFLYPGEIASLSSLAGRLPDEVNFQSGNSELVGKPVFWGHGTRDQLVPVEFGRAAVSQLESAGAVVTYCEDSVGHKLSASCYRSMEAFYKRQAF